MAKNKPYNKVVYGRSGGLGWIMLIYGMNFFFNYFIISSDKITSSIFWSFSSPFFTFSQRRNERCFAIFHKQHIPVWRWWFLRLHFVMIIVALLSVACLKTNYNRVYAGILLWSLWEAHKIQVLDSCFGCLSLSWLSVFTYFSE